VTVEFAEGNSHRLWFPSMRPKTWSWYFMEKP
jgi:hypothetical protein